MCASRVLYIALSQHLHEKAQARIMYTYGLAFAYHTGDRNRAYELSPTVTWFDVAIYHHPAPYFPPTVEKYLYSVLPAISSSSHACMSALNEHLHACVRAHMYVYA